MKRWYLIIGILLIISFAGISLLKQPDRSASTEQTPEAIRNAERTRITEFWNLYRTATRARIAGRYEEAEALYHQALQLNPQHEDALYYGGNVLLSLNKPEKAEQLWQRLLRVNPQSTRGLIQLGDLYLQEYSNPEQAGKYFDRAFRISKEETGPLLRLGRLALLKGNLQEAQQYLGDVRRAYDNVEAYFLSGYIAWKLEEEDSAFDLFSNSVKYATSMKAPSDFSSEGDTQAADSTEVASEEGLFAPWLERLTQSKTPSNHTEMMQYYREVEKYLRQLREKMQGGA